MIEFNAILYIAVFFICILIDKTLTVRNLLLGLYALSALLSVFFYNHPFIKLTVHFSSLSLEPFIYLFTLLMIFFSPLLTLNEAKIEAFEHPNLNKVYVVGWIGIIAGLISIIIIFPLALKGMTGDISLNRNETMSSGGVKFTTNGALGNIITLARSLDKISMILFFYQSVIRKQFNTFTWLLLIPAFFCPILYALAYVARGPLLFYSLLILAMFLVFRKFMTKRLQNVIIVTFSCFIIFLVIIFTVITLARFGATSQRTDNFGLEFFIYKYAGENFVNFNGLLYTHQRDVLFGDNCFPIFRKMLGLDYRVALDVHRIQGEATTGVPIWVLYTFVGDLLLDFGKVGTALIIIIVSLVFYKPIRFNKKISISYLILYFLFYTIAFEGLFIFSYQGLNQALIIIPLVYLYFKFDLTLLKKKAYTS